MADAGLLVPDILAWDEPQGFMLLTDLGRQTMMEQIQPDKPAANHGRYLQAVDTLLTWQLASKPGVLPAYDEPLLRRELQLFPDWYLAQHKGVTLEGSGGRDAEHRRSTASCSTTSPGPASTCTATSCPGT